MVYSFGLCDRCTATGRMHATTCTQRPRRLHTAATLMLLGVSLPLGGSAPAVHNDPGHWATNTTSANYARTPTGALERDCVFHFGDGCGNHTDFGGYGTRPDGSRQSMGSRARGGGRRSDGRRPGGRGLGGLPPGWVELPTTVEEGDMAWIKCDSRATAYAAAWLAPKSLLVGPLRTL